MVKIPFQIIAVRYPDLADPQRLHQTTGNARARPDDIRAVRRQPWDAQPRFPVHPIQPVSYTHLFGQDPLFTLHTSSVADILTQDAPITVSALSAGDAQAQVYIGDAQSDEALAYLAKVAFEKGWLPVGSAGLMAQCVQPQNPPAPCGAYRGGNGHIAILSASPSALSQAQLRAPGLSLQLLQADRGRF